MTELTSVVLVEDDPDIAELARIGLADFGGLEFKHFFSGDEALVGLKQNCPDIIVLDYRMPGMNGAELLIELRTAGIALNTPVVFMTASVMPHHVQRLKDLGAVEVIAKPFDPLTLADQLRSVYSSLR